MDCEACLEKISPSTIHSLSHTQTILDITAQQDAERAKYVVIGAMQEKKTIITKARGEAESAELIGNAVKKIGRAHV